MARNTFMPLIFWFTSIASHSARPVCRGTTIAANQRLLMNAFQKSGSQERTTEAECPAASSRSRRGAPRGVSPSGPRGGPAGVSARPSGAVWRSVPYASSSVLSIWLALFRRRGSFVVFDVRIDFGHSLIERPLYVPAVDDGLNRLVKGRGDRRVRGMGRGARPPPLRGLRDLNTGIAAGTELLGL